MSSGKKGTGTYKRHAAFFLHVIGKAGSVISAHLSKKIILYYMEMVEKSSGREATLQDINILFGAKLFCFASFGITGILIMSNLLLSMVVSVLCGCLGFFIPDIVLRKIGSAKENEIRSGLPYIVDLLNISTLAGQNIYNSLKTVSEVYRGAACNEIAGFLKAVDFGMGRMKAYSSFIAGKKSEDFKNLLFILLQSEKYGSTVNEILNQKTKYLRFELLQECERRSRRMSILLLFPLVFLVLPAFLLLTGGPLVFSVAGSF